MSNRALQKQYLPIYMDWKTKINMEKYRSEMNSFFTNMNLIYIVKCKKTVSLLNGIYCYSDLSQINLQVKQYI